jgi:hypothetical protein
LYISTKVDVTFQKCHIHLHRCQGLNITSMNMMLQEILYK